MIVLELAPLTTNLSLLLLSAYPVLDYLIYHCQQQEGLGSKQAWLYSAFCFLGKFASV
ncbi:MAG: hypothetical protein ACQJCO_03540 [cyanobacterium endosymbiont of Rhopalodia sterrenbergii]